MAVGVQRRTAVARTVLATITHVSDRMLAIQRFGDDAWRLPGGPITPEEDAEVRLRQYVRCATGFEIRNLAATGGGQPGCDGVVEFIRCEIRGVGSDITFRTRTMRWMDRAAILTHMDHVAAQGMIEALDAHAGAESRHLPRHGSPTLLTSS